MPGYHESGVAKSSLYHPVGQLMPVAAAHPFLQASSVLSGMEGLSEGLPLACPHLTEYMLERKGARGGPSEPPCMTVHHLPT